MSTHTGTCAQRRITPYCAVVSARIEVNSNPAITPAATALHEHSKYTHPWRCLHQTSRYIPASVKHNAASTDQSSVTQLIGRGPASRWCENRAGSTRSRSIPKRSRFHATPRREKPRGDFVRLRELSIDRPGRRRARALIFLAVAKQPLRKPKRRASPLL